MKKNTKNLILLAAMSVIGVATAHAGATPVGGGGVGSSAVLGGAGFTPTTPSIGPSVAPTVSTGGGSSTGGSSTGGSSTGGDTSVDTTQSATGGGSDGGSNSSGSGDSSGDSNKK